MLNRIINYFKAFFGVICIFLWGAFYLSPIGIGLLVANYAFPTNTIAAVICIALGIIGTLSFIFTGESDDEPHHGD